MSLLPEVLRDIADKLRHPREHVLSVWIAAGHPGATLNTVLSLAERGEIFKLLMNTASDHGSSQVTSIATTNESSSRGNPSATVAAKTADPESSPVAVEDGDGAEPSPTRDGYVVPTDPDLAALRDAVKKRLEVEETLRTAERALARVERERDELLRQIRDRAPAAPMGPPADDSARIQDLEDRLAEEQRTGARLRRDLRKCEARIGVAEETLRTREQELAEAQAELAESRRRSRTLQREHKELAAAVERLGNRSILECAFASPEVQDWIARNRRSTEFAIREGVVLLGNGPMVCDQIASLIKRAGEPVLEVGSRYADVLVLGRDDFFIEDIETQIRARSGETLRIFSQEMFLAALLLNDDPFRSASRITLKAFAEGHPALELLLKFGFEWPSVDADRLGSALFEADLEIDESPPHRMGYVVGVTKGLGEAARREVLAAAFSDEIPVVGKKKYMQAWGTPGSPARLRRMASHLSWLVRTRRGRDSMETARAEWASDLEWLHDQYFENWMRFRWPDHKVD